MSTLARDRHEVVCPQASALPDSDLAARDRTTIQQKIRKAETADAHEEALTLAQAGLTAHPGDIGLTVAAARQECSLGRYDDGRSRIDTALKDHGLAPELLALRARIAHYEGDQELALSLLQKAELDDPFGVAASVLQTRVLIALDRPQEAWTVLSDAARFRPHALPVLFNLARLVDDQDQLHAFYRIWLKARGDDEAFANAVRPLITACLRARDFDRAAAALRRAIAIVLDSEGAVRPKVRDRALGRDGGRALVDVVTRLQAYGVPHFLCAGTCLGAIREGKLLSFDNDIDIGIYEEDFDRGRLVEVFREDANFRVQEIDRINPKVGLQHWNGVALDLFKFYREDGKVWHNGTFTRWWNTPFDLAPIQMYGMTMSVPAQAELYLEECYGDWRTPKPTFDAFFEGPNAVNKWAEYFQVYLLRKAFEVISRGDLELAKRYTDRFPDTFAGIDLNALSPLRPRHPHNKQKRRASRHDKDIRNVTMVTVAQSQTAQPGFIDCCRDLIERGHAAIAVEMLTDFVRVDPSHVEALTLLGRAHRATGNGDAAKRCFIEADMAEPGYLPARLLHAETLVSEGQSAAAKDLLYDTADWRPTESRVLQEIAGLTEDRSDYLRLRRQWLVGRMNGMVAPGGARAVAKAAALVGDFPAAVDVYRWLIRGQIERIGDDKAANLIAPPRTAMGRVGNGRGERALHDLKTLLQQAKTPFFLISGTLLGYLREGRMLAGDKDIDVGVFRKDYDHKKLVKAFQRSPLFEVKRLDNIDRLRVSHVNGVWIDVFPPYPEGDLIWHDGTATRWSNTPFEIGSITVDGQEYAIPLPPERYLDENYGDWRTPNSMFDVRYEAPNAQVLSTDYLHLLVYTRVFEGLMGNKWEIVRKYARDFADLFRDPVLEAARLEAEGIVAHLEASAAAVRVGQPAPKFPEAERAARHHSAVRRAKARTGQTIATHDPGPRQLATPTRRSNTVRVTRWFRKRWRRWVLRSDPPTR